MKNGKPEVFGQAAKWWFKNVRTDPFMNIISLRFLLYGLVIILNACVSMAQDSDSKMTSGEASQTNPTAPAAPIFMNADFYLTPEQITNLMDKASHGNADSAYRLSLYYGFVTDSDPDQLKWLARASNLGNLQATYNLACYYEYIIHPRQYQRALALFRVVAKKGNADAMAALGEIYEQGNGVKISTNMAIYWYEKAAGEGKVFEMEKLALLLCGKQEVSEAYIWAKVAAIRRARAHIKNNDALLAKLSSDLESNQLAKLDDRAVKQDEKLPYIDNWTEW